MSTTYICASGHRSEYPRELTYRELRNPGCFACGKPVNRLAVSEPAPDAPRSVDWAQGPAPSFAAEPSPVPAYEPPTPAPAPFESGGGGDFGGGGSDNTW
jgi:hypothetical protein